MKKIEITTWVYQYDSVEELPTDEQNLIKVAKEAVNNAYAPYSQFNVGAAVLLDNGEIIAGTNQENAAYPSGLCAERVAVFYANSKYPNSAILKLAVTARTGGEFLEPSVPPCGSCRQVLMETEIRFSHPIKIILAGKKTVRILDNAKSLLPLNFDDKFLDK